MGARAKSKRTSSKRKQDDPLKLASAVSDRVEFEDIRLLRSRCQQTPDLLGSGQQTVQWGTHVDTHVDPETGRIFVLPSFRMQAHRADGDPKELSVEVGAAFMLVYRADSLSGLTDENYEKFGSINGVYNAWPYWREFVQNTIARMGLPRLLAPVHRVGAPRRKAPRKRPSSARTRKTNTKG